MMIRFRHIAAVCGLLYSFQAQADVNIAVIAPQNTEAVGNGIVTGAEIAVDEINKNGGLMGKKINLIKIDDPCQNSLSLSTAQMLALNKEDKTALVVGPYCQNQLSEITQTLAHSGIFQIVPSAVYAANADKKFDSLIMLPFYKEAMMQTFFDYMQENFPDYKCAVIFDAKNADMAVAAQEVFAQNNQADKLLTYTFEDNDFDYDKISELVFNNQVKAALVLSGTEHAGRMTEEFRAHQRDYLVFTDKYQVMPYFANILGDLMEGTYFLELPSLKDNPDFAETLVNLRLSGVELQGLSVYGYSAVRLWAKAAEGAKSFDSRKIAGFLKTAPTQSDWSYQIFFNTKNTPVHYDIVQYKDGEYTQVY